MCKVSASYTPSAESFTDYAAKQSLLHPHSKATKQTPLQQAKSLQAMQHMQSLLQAMQSLLQTIQCLLQVVQSLLQAMQKALHSWQILAVLPHSVQKTLYSLILIVVFHVYSRQLRSSYTIIENTL